MELLASELSFSFAAASATHREVEQTGNVVACTHGSRCSDSLRLEACPKEDREEEEEGVGCLAASSPREESGWPAACRLKSLICQKAQSQLARVTRFLPASRARRVEGRRSSGEPVALQSPPDSPLSSAAERARPPARPPARRVSLLESIRKGWSDFCFFLVPAGDRSPPFLLLARA